ncbi:MAG: type III polyketide synthase [Chitinophagaceae bacterium]|nr:type III polyketide synthase [Chitinophagaceae bacterium]
MSKIVSVGTAVPAYCHQQDDIMNFMQTVYATTRLDERKIYFLYQQSAIRKRYSVLSECSQFIHEWKLYSQTENFEAVPSLEQRMMVYNKQAPQLSVDAIRDCLNGIITTNEITHLITASCTGMSAPGLDLQIMEMLDLKKNIFRTSINFMGCYAAIHGLKMADAICKNDASAKVVVVCTELCTLHFQREATMDNIASSLLFADGSAAVLVTSDENDFNGLRLKTFYSEVVPKGKRDMAWELSSSGFLMTLSNYVPELLEEDFAALVEKSLQISDFSKHDISHWCIHPGGRKILEAIQKSLQIHHSDLSASYQVLSEYGNMSSPTILFVLKNILDDNEPNKKVFGAAFGPGLTVETFTASS